jgi:hypothetical protein
MKLTKPGAIGASQLIPVFAGRVDLKWASWRTRITITAVLAAGSSSYVPASTLEWQQNMPEALVPGYVGFRALAVDGDVASLSLQLRPSSWL